MKKWPKDKTKTLRAEDLVKPVLKVIRAGYKLKRKEPVCSIPYNGYNIGADELACCFPPKKVFLKADWSIPRSRVGRYWNQRCT